MATLDGLRGRLRHVVGSPALLVLVLAPVFGEGLSGSGPPLDLLVPWTFAFMVALYGCGALVCREVAHRFDLGFPGLMLLAAAYGVWEEGLVDRYWYLPAFWEDSGVGDYGVVWHTNVLLAAHLTLFHTAISICSSVLVVEWLAPRARNGPWVGRRTLVVAGLVLAATPLFYGELAQRPPVAVLVAAAGLLCALVVAAFMTGRAHPCAAPSTRLPTKTPRRGLARVVFGCVLAHWVLTYTVAGTGVPWPLGVGLALLPVAVGVLAVTGRSTTGPYGADGIRVVVGLLAFFALLDLLVAVLGRYDMALSCLFAAWLAQHLYRRRAVLARWDRA